MPALKPLPFSQEFLRERFSYDPATGILLCRQGNKGYEVAGYRYANIKHKGYKVHRLVWKWMTGEDPPPKHQIDHIDRDPGNNRWSNLRLASHSQNTCNRTPKSERPNVIWDPRGRKWRVWIQVNRKKIRFGGYSDEEEAKRVAREARQKYHGVFACDYLSETPEGGWPEGM